MPAHALQPAAEPVFWLLDMAGISVFAASGALTAARKRLDIVAAWFFAIITAIGGGTLRDLLIGAPVFWIRQPAPVIVCLAVATAVWATPRRWWPERSLEWLDAIGLAAYAVFGASKAMRFGVSPVPAAAMGVVTACMGGVIRDVTAGVPSILLRQELYVTVALLAAGTYVGLNLLDVPKPWPVVVSFLAGLSLRAAALRWNLTLPAHKG
jgi:uncharacterized membrane protein YeiH